MPTKFFPSIPTLINLFLFVSFSLLAVLWILIKLNVAYKLVPSLSFTAYLDIIRSHLSLDLAICLLFFTNFIFNLKHEHTSLKYLKTAIASLLYILIVFYFLKLTGLYAYTHDPTPYSMIEYGTYMLNLPFAGKNLALIGYVCLPILLFLSLYFLLYKNISRLLLPEKKSTYYKLLGAIALLIPLSFIPPQQKGLVLGIAYHPYVYSGFISQKEFNIENSPRASRTNKNEKKLSNTAIENKKNIVIVILESMGASTIQENITPFLYQLKNNATSFEHAYAVIPHTSKALVTIHCGDIAYLSPYLLESNLGVATPCLAEQLKANNYQSVFFQSVTQFFENRQALVNKLGFDEFFPLESMDTSNYEAVNYFGYEDDIMLPISKHWLIERETDKAFFASYLTGTSHHNYHTPSHYPLRQFHHKNNFNRYLNAASYVDRFVAKLIQQYKDLGIYENTLFIIVGDHGEGFGDHRPLMHNNNIYNSALKIPLIIHDGSHPFTPKMINTLTSQSEIRDLIIGILNAENINPDNDKNPKSIISSCWYPDYCYSLIQQDGTKLHKFILDVANHKKELYELNSNPDEKNNLIANHAALSKQLENKLKLNIYNHEKFYEDFYNHKYNNYLDLKIESFSKFKSVNR